MIDPKELRIGNFVSDLFDPQIKSFVENGVLLTNGQTRTFSYLSPVPLFYNWLFKAGFKRLIIDDKVIYVLGLFSLEPYGGNAFAFTWHRLGHVIVCEYVHELQNLYYAITRIELKFNMESDCY